MKNIYDIMHAVFLVIQIITFAHIARIYLGVYYLTQNIVARFVLENQRAPVTISI